MLFWNPQERRKDKMKLFNGRIRRCLPDREGLVRFIFEHASGAVLELRIKPGPVLPLPEQRVIVRGELLAAATIFGSSLRVLSLI